MKKPTFTVRQLTACAIVAALYAVITIASGPLAYDLMQFRLSEALIVLCWFEPVLGVGVTLGCFLANIFSTVTALDMIIGTLATGVACLITPHIKNPWLMPLPNILSNAILVGGMLAYVIFPEISSPASSLPLPRWASASWWSCMCWACPCSLPCAKPASLQNFANPPALRDNFL